MQSPKKWNYFGTLNLNEFDLWKFIFPLDFRIEIIDIFFQASDKMLKFKFVFLSLNRKKKS